ncbi:MAG: FMN-binding negative transcriptional regulator [Pseudorhodobacter sp.]|nr:FMN-binding negative transcriptional regulator [Pseudorhodobacter sp.]
MYVPAHFAEHHREVLFALIDANPLGMLVTHGAGGLDANHIPFALQKDGRLEAHVARANPVWQEVADGAEVLVVFRAGDAYISPNWYPSKHALHRQVPSWNYRVVHAHGRITVRDDESFVRRNVARLTKTHEATQPVPWKMGDAPREYIDQMVKAIVGIESEVTRLVGKLKLSQNKDARDIAAAGQALTEGGHGVIGAAMLDQAARK